jgi:hypothetical protein
VRWAFIALWLCACARQPAAADASIRVVVATLTSSAQITRVSVTVTPADVSADLTRDPAGTFSGTLTVAAGAQTVTASAWAGTMLAGSGTGSVTVVKGRTATLLITALDVTGPAPLPNHSPVVTSLVASATAVALGDQVSLVATAMDADGDAITFGWSAAPAGCGTFATPGSASTIWTAAAVGTCAVTITAGARGQSDSRSMSILVNPPAGGPPRPTLVQHVSSSANPTGVGEPGNAFKFTLPNPVRSGNCLILGMSYLWSATRTISITDDNGNVWPAAPAVTTTDGTALIVSIFVLPNANAGVTTITVTFDTALLPFQYTLSEFYNVATAAPTSGSSSSKATISPSLATGSFTPGNNDANGGNLIWTYFAYPYSGLSGFFPTTFAAGGTFSLLDADIAWHEQGFPHASEYFVQATAAPINPGMTATMSGGNDFFLGASIALKAASAGTAPPEGIRIVRVSHQTNQNTLGTRTAWDLQFPCSGNLIVLVTHEYAIIPINSITDNRGNDYVARALEDDEPQFWTVSGATPGNDLKMTLNLTAGALSSTVVLYDIVGADPAPVDGVAGTPVAADPSSGGHSADINNAPQITPVSLGLTIAAVDLGIGPISGLLPGTPPGAIFDLVTYAGETDNSTMDNADGKAHVYNTDLTPEHWNWGPILNDLTVDVNYSSTAVHFKAAATP